MNKLARVGVAAVLLVMGVALSTSVAIATPPAHKQAVIYTQSVGGYADWVQETADECAAAVILTAQAFGISKAQASELYNKCLIDSKVTI